MRENFILKREGTVGFGGEMKLNKPDAFAYFFFFIFLDILGFFCFLVILKGKCRKRQSKLRKNITAIGKKENTRENYE